MSYRLLGERPSSHAGRRFIIIKDLFLCDIGLMAGERVTGVMDCPGHGRDADNLLI